MAAQVGSAFVAVMPSFRGFRKGVDAEVGAAGASSAKTFSSKMASGGSSAGAALGKSVKGGFSAEASNLGTAELKKLTSDVRSAASAYSTAVQKNADAIGKVKIAEAALADVRAKGNATSAQLVRAEENLASAQRKASAASDALTAAGERVTASKEALATAEKQAAAATEQMSSAAQSGSSWLSRFKASMQEGASAARDYDSANDGAVGSMKGWAVGGAVAGVVSSVTSTITSSLGSLAGEAVTASDATDKFKQSMNFAGISSSEIEDVTAKTQAYADLTVYSLDDIQNATAQLASNGVPDYEALVEAAGNLNAVAGGSASTFSSVTTVLSQTAAAGKLTTENWYQLRDAIPGAAGQLQSALESAGAYTGNFADALTDGQVSADEFNTALMSLGTQPIAQEAATSTETFEGMLGNLQATIVGGLSEALTAVKPQLSDLASGFSDMAVSVIPSVVSAATTAGQVIGNVISFVSSNGDWLGPLVAGIVAFVAVGKTVMLVTQAINFFKDATTVATAVQQLFNGTLLANPIGLVITAIAALVAGLIWFFTQTETGRQIWAAFMAWLQSAWQAIGDFFVTLWNGISSFVTGAINGIAAVIGAVTGAISSTWSAVWGGISSFFIGIWNGIIAAVSWLGDAFSNVFGGISGMVSSAFSGVVGIVKGPINGIISLVNSAIGALNGISVTIPDWVPGIGGQTWGVDLPTIPMLATGGVIARGGWAVVGERGPELVNLPGRSTVYDAGQSAGVLGGPTVNINVTAAASDSTEQKLLKASRRARAVLGV